MRKSFWQALDALVADSTIVVEQPRGSTDPRFPAFRFPHDYGYLEGTNAPDGEEIDVWIGSLKGRQVTGVVCTVDLAKRDAEIKVLIGCSSEDARTIVESHNMGSQSCILVERSCP